MTAGRLVPPLAVTLLAAAFVMLNRGETVVVNLGVARFYQAPLTMVAFVSFLVGMLAMLAMGLCHDLRVRRALQENGMLEHRPAGGRRSSRTEAAAGMYDADPPVDAEDAFR